MAELPLEMKANAFRGRVASAGSVAQSALPLGALLLAAATLYHIIPAHEFGMLRHTLLGFGLIGLCRYSWVITNHLRAAVWVLRAFPKLRRRERALPDAARYPKRLYVIVPSYKEDPRITRRVIHALAKELIGVESRVLLLFNVASAEEADLIQSLASRQLAGAHANVEMTFMLQRQGKRIALGQSLRAVSRDFHRLTDWHGDADNDIVVLMDGDTELMPGALRRTLGFFRLDANLGALTTDEIADFLEPEPVMDTWFAKKFVRRHVMMSSHSLSYRVLTLTGRFSVFRAKPLLSESFISGIENDHLEHWAFGRFRFLMGDDKSTWYQMLRRRWRMIYVPDCCIQSVESRTGDFFTVSKGLMRRWFGNMARNNWRALQIGPRNMPFFIWLAILDQRLSIWSTLMGPVSALLATLFITPYALLIYMVWVLITRVIYMSLFVPYGLRVQLLNLPLLLYDQWYGALIKFNALMHPHQQSWSKGGAKEEAVHALSPLRRFVIRYRFAFSAAVFLVVTLLAAGTLPWPRHLHLLPSAVAAVPVPASVKVVNLPAEKSADWPALVRQAQADTAGSAMLEIRLPAGQFEVAAPLVITRSFTRLVGAGRDKTHLLAHLPAGPEAGYAVIEVMGERGPVIGRLTKPARPGDANLATTVQAGLYSTGHFWFGAPNDQAFFDALGSKAWRREQPWLRQWIGAARNDAGTLTVERPLLAELPAGSQIRSTRMVDHVFLSGFSIKQPGAPGAAPMPTVYENLHPELAVDSLRFDWVADSVVEDVDIINTGRHALVFENSLGVVARRLHIDGAWNKGAEGRGYVRFSRAYYCTLEESDVRNIRHVAFQWSAAGNRVLRSHLMVDVNFHGGYSHDNVVAETLIDPPPTHTWGRISTTPSDAHWAPPDGGGNEVRPLLPQPR